MNRSFCFAAQIFAGDIYQILKDFDEAQAIAMNRRQTRLQLDRGAGCSQPAFYQADSLPHNSLR